MNIIKFSACCSVFLTSLFFTACGDLSSSDDSDDSNYDASANTLKDLRDGHVYRTVKISGNVVWMAENLNFKTSGSYCYDDDEKNCAKYGRLYTWAAAIDSVGDFSSTGKGCGDGTTCALNSSGAPVRGVCPKGWFLPDIGIWTSMIETVGGWLDAGEVLKSADGWNGSDEYSFSVLPAGVKRYDGLYVKEGERSSFWTSSQIDHEYTYSVDFFNDYGRAFNDFEHKYNGYSVRCVTFISE